MKKKIISQQEFWEQESLDFFRRNYHGKKLDALEPNLYLKDMLELIELNLKNKNILEIGCGAGNNLKFLQKEFNARCVGTERSSKVIKILSENFPNIEFYSCDSTNLPFESDKFNLVILRGVLCWVDRNYIYQTIGEAIRVTKDYLFISEFCPDSPYATVYHHNPNYVTFKLDYQGLLDSGGIMKCILSKVYNQKDQWKVIKSSLYQKLEFKTRYGIKKESDFK